MKFSIRCFSPFLTSFILALTANSVFGQEFRIIGEGRYAEINGEIDVGGDEKFLSFLNSNPRIIGVRLNSLGGVVVSALAMAEEISRRRLSTYIADEDTCASACSILFFAGHDRIVKGRIGVHQMDDGGRSNASALQFVLAEQLDAFQRFGVPWTVTQYMLTTPPWDMHWISEYDIVNLGLNRDLPGDASDYAVLQPKPSASTTPTSPRFGFADYPLRKLLVGGPKQPDFNGRDADFRSFRTRIGEGAAQGVNFAGHYSFIEVGCGTSCRFAFVVDLQTGEVGSFPYGGEEQYQMKLLYSPDSRLLKVRWKGDWDSDTCTEQDMLIDGLDWSVLDERTAPLINGFCDY